MGRKKEGRKERGFFGGEGVGAYLVFALRCVEIRCIKRILVSLSEISTRGAVLNS